MRDRHLNNDLRFHSERSLNGVDKITKVNNHNHPQEKNPTLEDSSHSFKAFPIPNCTSENFVGFSKVAQQVRRKAVLKEFDFVLMVVGETGLGKSTLMNSLFFTEISSSKKGKILTTNKTTSLEVHKKLLEENGVKLMLTVIDTPGFGDAVDNSDCWESASTYVENQFKEHLEEELRVERQERRDSRVHACLYFIAPTGHGLKKIDIEFMRKIHDKVNIIPIIGKADTFTKHELSLFKEKVKAWHKHLYILFWEKQFKGHIYGTRLV